MVAGVSFLLARKPRAATYLGAWIVLPVVAIYGPDLSWALADPSTSVQVEGANYFADTLLFAGRRQPEATRASLVAQGSERVHTRGVARRRPCR